MLVGVLLAPQSVTISSASSRSNPKVQVEAIEGGALQKLLVILATDQPLPAKKKASLLLAPVWRLAFLLDLKGKGSFPHTPQSTTIEESSHRLTPVSSRGQVEPLLNDLASPPQSPEPCCWLPTCLLSFVEVI